MKRTGRTAPDAAGRGKLPGEDTGVRVVPTMCDICTPGLQCGVSAYVKDGVIVKLEGTDGFPVSNGRLCTKGAAGRQYLYREDRIRTPLRRVGPRGSGRFEPVSWDDALELCAQALLRQRERDPDGVVWLTGYPKWYRPMLHRLAHSFGTENYLTESSACHRATVMSALAIFGREMRVSPARAGVVLCWGQNPMVSPFPLASALRAVRERGGRVVVIDPRRTQTAERLSDLHLRPRAGSDAALAHAMAYHILENGWEDRAFLARYVHGFDAYRDYVAGFSPERAEALCGVPAEDIRRAAEWLALDPTGVVLPSNALTHRINGFNTHRAVLCLMVLLGRVDKPGGFTPDNDSYCHSDGGFSSNELRFIDEVRPRHCKLPVGAERFPLWADMVDEGQGMDLIRQMETGDPYPIRALACFGVNDRMYPESSRLLRAMDALDFSFAMDFFHTDVCDHADIVLPACTSYERGEARCYAGRFINFTKPAVPPLYESRPDTDVICDLSRRMGLHDPLLDAGYDACIEYIFAPAGVEDWQAVKDAPLPVETPRRTPYEYGRYLAAIPTPSGKIELYSEAVAKYADRGLTPLPEYRPDPTAPDYPLNLISGARLPNTIHSRGHEVPWLRALRPEPTADLNPADARALGIGEGDAIELQSPVGSIRVRAHLTEEAAPGDVLMIHGYREANVNELIPLDHLDPHTGFPGYKQAPCRVRRAGAEEAL